MIIPIGHDQSIRRYPWVTIGLIVLCTVVQIWATTTEPSRAEVEALQAELSSVRTDEEAQELVERAERLVNRIPTWRFGYHTGKDDDDDSDTSSGFSYRLITSAFVHEGWFHLIGNMLFLWLVGSALEDRWGRLKFLGFYLAGAVAATFAFELTYSGSETTLVGASGAVSAAMGAFLVYFYKTEITLWYFLMYRTGTFRIAAYIALPLWLGDQVLMANLDKSAPGMSSVAYAAHIGGFAFGAIVAVIAQMMFGNKTPADDDDGVDDRPAPPRNDDRERQLLEAIHKRDLAAVRTLGSRVLIDLGRAKDHERILDLYRAIGGAGFSVMPLTDGAFVAAATAADATRDVAAYIGIAGALRSEHPGSTHVPKVLWRLAELHAEGNATDAALETLKLLAERYPRSEYGARAAKRLAQ